MKAVIGLGELVIEAAGTALGQPQAELVGALRVTQALSVPAQCELTFQGGGDDFGNRAAQLMGLSLSVRGDDGPVFTGDITAVEHTYSPDGAREVRLRAYDALHRLRKRQSV